MTRVGKPNLAEDAKNFASICKVPLGKTPSLEDFLARRNIPQAIITVSPGARAGPLRYRSAYPVLDARDYLLCSRHIGDVVELIGRIVEVKVGTTRYGKPYVFINFGPWKGDVVKISIWSEGLANLKNTPTDSWVGQWITVIGLMEPPYQSRKFEYSIAIHFSKVAVSLAALPAFGIRPRANVNSF